MKAMILAAGKGTRMQPLTKAIPKPLVEIHGKPLIVYHLEALATADITDVIINVSEYSKKIMPTLDDGSDYGINIHYSIEETLLDTGGGIVNALPILGDAPFIIINGDVWTDYPMQQLKRQPEKLAHIVMVDNPAHRPQGDFYLHDNHVTSTGENKLTYAGIGIYTPEFFAGCVKEKFSLGPLLHEQVAKQQVTGEYYQDIWQVVDSPAQVQELNQE